MTARSAISDSPSFLADSRNGGVLAGWHVPYALTTLRWRSL